MVKTVQEMTQRTRHAALIYVQLMEIGDCGVSILHAQNHVEMVHQQELDSVSIYQ